MFSSACFLLTDRVLWTQRDSLLPRPSPFDSALLSARYPTIVSIDSCRRQSSWTREMQPSLNCSGSTLVPWPVPYLRNLHWRWLTIRTTCGLLAFIFCQNHDWNQLSPSFLKYDKMNYLEGHRIPPSQYAEQPLHLKASVTVVVHRPQFVRFRIWLAARCYPPSRVAIVFKWNILQVHCLAWFRFPRSVYYASFFPLCLQVSCHVRLQMPVTFRQFLTLLPFKAPLRHHHSTSTPFAAVSSYSCTTVHPSDTILLQTGETSDAKP